ncbi:MAG: hypothetical protein EXS63_03645 [Candidatus Omnitrophica bacterium]|nr:hypothetical protein [Candidatus Omnitrophota bacterium]
MNTKKLKLKTAAFTAVLFLCSGWMPSSPVLYADPTDSLDSPVNRQIPATPVEEAVSRMTAEKPLESLPGSLPSSLDPPRSPVRKSITTAQSTTSKPLNVPIVVDPATVSVLRRTPEQQISIPEDAVFVPGGPAGQVFYVQTTSRDVMVYQVTGKGIKAQSLISWDPESLSNKPGVQSAARVYVSKDAKTVVAEVVQQTAAESASYLYLVNWESGAKAKLPIPHDELRNIQNTDSEIVITTASETIRVDRQTMIDDQGKVSIEQVLKKIDSRVYELSSAQWMQLVNSSEMKSLLGKVSVATNFNVLLSDGRKMQGTLSPTFLSSEDSYFTITLEHNSLMSIGLYSKTEKTIKFSDVVGANDLTDPAGQSQFMKTLRELVIHPEKPAKDTLLSLDHDIDLWEKKQIGASWKVNYSKEVMSVLAKLLSPVFRNWDSYYSILPKSGSRDRKTTYDLSDLYASFLFHPALVNVDPQKMAQNIFNVLKENDWDQFCSFVCSIEAPYLGAAYIKDLYVILQRLKNTLPDNGPERSWIVKQWADFFDYDFHYDRIFSRPDMIYPDKFKNYYSLITMIRGIARNDKDVQTVMSELKMPANDKRREIFDDFGILLWSSGSGNVTAEEANKIYNYLSLYPADLVSEFGIIVEASSCCGEGTAVVGRPGSITIYNGIDTMSADRFHHEMWHILTIVRTWGEFQYLYQKNFATFGGIQSQLFSLGNPEDRPTDYANSFYTESVAEFGGRQFMANTEAAFNGWLQKAITQSQFIGLRTLLSMMEILASHNGAQSDLSMPIYKGYQKVGEIPIQMDAHKNITMMEWTSRSLRYHFTYTADDLLITTVTIETIATGEQQIIENNFGILHGAELNKSLTKLDHYDGQGVIISKDYFVAGLKIKTEHFDSSGKMIRYDFYHYQSSGKLTEKISYQLIEQLNRDISLTPYPISRKTSLEHFDLNSGQKTDTNLFIYNSSYTQIEFSGSPDTLIDHPLIFSDGPDFSGKIIFSPQDGSYRLDRFFEINNRVTTYFSFFYDPYGAIYKREYYVLSYGKVFFIEKGTATQRSNGTIIHTWNNVSLEPPSSKNHREYIFDDWTGIPV